MNTSEIEKIDLIKSLFHRNEKKFVYENQKGNSVNCKLIEDGIEVDCLSDSGHKNFLPWAVFRQAIHIMLKQDGRAERGSAVHKLGSTELPLNSIEGYVAATVYGKTEGDSVFRRISPIAHILISSGICIDQRGDMQLDSTK